MESLRTDRSIDYCLFSNGKKRGRRIKKRRGQRKGKRRKMALPVSENTKAPEDNDLWIKEP